MSQHEKFSDRTPDPDELVTVEQVSSWVHVPEATLYQWRYRGVGPRSIRVGKYVRYRSADVRAWIARQAAATGRGDAA